MIAQAFRAGLGLREIQSACRYDPWFLRADPGAGRDRGAGPRRGPAGGRAGLRELKAMGFSDARLATLAGLSEAAVAARRQALGVHPVFKRVDTCAAEFEARTPYLYSCYETGLADGEGDAGRMRGLAQRAAQGDHPGQRAEPDRPGHRVRLLLRPRRVRPRRGRLRDDHGQLQPGDRLDRLRHLGPALLRAADRRGRARDRPRRGERGRACGRDRAARRPDAAQARPAARRGRRADPRHLARRDRPRRGSRALPEAAAAARPAPAGQRHLQRPARTRWARPSASASRSCCGRPTCSAARRCGSSTAPPRSRSSWPRRASSPSSGRS